jgi:hypothetical protein
MASRDSNPASKMGLFDHGFTWAVEEICTPMGASAKAFHQKRLRGRFAADTSAKLGPATVRNKLDRGAFRKNHVSVKLYPDERFLFREHC